LRRRLFLALIAAYAARASTAHALPRPQAPRRVRLKNAHTGETFEGTYRGDKGPIGPVMDELCVFLRDHYSGEKTQIDVGVIDFLADVLNAVGETKATILSAYRTAETNKILARTTFGVADSSQHIYGRALDFHVDSKLLEAMTAARAMKRGGVGWYPHSGFIHIDTGPVRNWNLDERGLDHLLEFNPRQLVIADDGGLTLGASGHPLTVAQRLELHRRLTRAQLPGRNW
jgi:uncharacterized protein YcbK (DUF882 family)